MIDSTLSIIKKRRAHLKLLPPAIRRVYWKVTIATPTFPQNRAPIRAGPGCSPLEDYKVNSARRLTRGEAHAYRDFLADTPITP